MGEETATEQPDNFVPRVKTTAFSPHVLLWTDGVLSLLLRCPNAELSFVINSPHSCVCVCVSVSANVCPCTCEPAYPRSGDAQPRLLQDSAMCEGGTHSGGFC